MRLNPAPAGRRQKGLSLVELMVGIAVGLFVLAGATMLVATQLGDNRRLLLETQLQQDLRATMDIVTRELRRAGASPEASSSNIWRPDRQPARTLAIAAVQIAGDGSEVTFRHRRMGAEGPYGFRWADGRIRSLLIDNWQELTDPNVMRITAFNVEQENESTEALPCPRLCADGSADCWPIVTIRTLTVRIEAESVSDPSIRRAQSSQVRLRNDILGLNTDPSHPLCPA